MPRPRTRSDDQVLDAVEEVLSRQGPHAFTLADVAKRAKLSPATLVQRFGTKRGLLLAFARRSAATSIEPFGSGSGKSPLETLRRGLLALAGPVADRRALRNSIAMLLEDLGNAELRALAAKQAKAREKRVQELLEEAVGRREITLADPAAHARLLYAAWNGALILWAMRGEGELRPFLERALFDWIESRRTKKR